MRFRLNLALGALLLNAAATPAMAQKPGHGPVPMGGKVEAPLGYSAMCEASPALCRSFAPEASYATTPAKSPLIPAAQHEGLLRHPTAALAKSSIGQAQVGPSEGEQPNPQVTQLDGPQRDETRLMAALYRINLRVNRVVAQKTDMAQYGLEEIWRPSGHGPQAAGDCEDLALEKRVELLAEHFPADRLYMAVVYSRASGLHAVLVARMAQGDLVLDSRSNAIKPWDATGYQWLSVQSPLAPQEWYLAG